MILVPEGNVSGGEFGCAPNMNVAVYKEMVGRLYEGCGVFVDAIGIFRGHGVRVDEYVVNPSFVGSGVATPL